jgi:hypothetical protein
MFCRSLCVLFLLVIVLSILRFTNSDYPFGIFKLLMMKIWLTITVKLWTYAKYDDFVHLSWLTTGFLTGVRLSRPLGKQYLHTHSEHFISLCCSISVAKSLVFSVVLCKSLFLAIDGFKLLTHFYFLWCQNNWNSYLTNNIFNKYNFIAIYTKLSRNSSLQL